MRVKYGVETFSLPGQENQFEELLNNPDYEVIDELKVPCPKEGIILVYIKYEDKSKSQGGPLL